MMPSSLSQDQLDTDHAVLQVNVLVAKRAELAKPEAGVTGRRPHRANVVRQGRDQLRRLIRRGDPVTTPADRCKLHASQGLICTSPLATALR
jgi:hypothetical protein